MDEPATTPESPQADAPDLNLDLILDVEVDVSVQLGSCTMTMGEVLNLAPGNVVQLRQNKNEPVLLCLNDKVVARGEVVVVEEKLGIKITEMLDS
ncbi:MAG: flagellar motor switch protein FliN [Bdellovibrionales bacterium]|nr:flagellar motor switch protein FliN [Bdellovibrionales bacterium]